MSRGPRALRTHALPKWAAFWRYSRQMHDEVGIVCFDPSNEGSRDPQSRRKERGRENRHEHRAHSQGERSGDRRRAPQDYAHEDHRPHERKGRNYSEQSHHVGGYKSGISRCPREEGYAILDGNRDAIHLLRVARSSSAVKAQCGKWRARRQGPPLRRESRPARVSIQGRREAVDYSEARRSPRPCRRSSPTSRTRGSRPRRSFGDARRTAQVPSANSTRVRGSLPLSPHSMYRRCAEDATRDSSEPDASQLMPASGKSTVAPSISACAIASDNSRRSPPSPPPAPREAMKASRRRLSPHRVALDSLLARALVSKVHGSRDPEM
jgi:hypothetical protein